MEIQMPVPGKEKPGAVRSGNRAKGIFAMTGLPGRRPRLKFSKDERMRRLRLGDLRKLLRDRCHGPVLPDVTLAANIWSSCCCRFP
jgi:hypothetical protein